MNNEEYHSSNRRSKVYHTNKDCRKGKTIKEEHWMPGPGTDKKLCEDCEMHSHAV